MLWKQGIKLWADGSPWVGTAALSFPYLDSEAVAAAQIPIGPSGEANMNYSRSELDAILDEFAAARAGSSRSTATATSGWTWSSTATRPDSAVTDCWAPITVGGWSTAVPAGATSSSGRRASA